MGRQDPKKRREKDEITVKYIGDWVVTCSPSKKCLYLDTASYQTLKLKLAKKDLQELMEILDKEIKR